MITIETLRNIILESPKALRKKTILTREKEIPLKSNRVIVITGVRRCGKSTLLLQLLEGTEKKISLNFEDTRLNDFEFDDFLKLEQIAVSEKITTFVFDEIQNIPGWEKFVRSVHDKGYYVYVTGSNASMLSRELGTRLTGRHLQTELFPFSYNEYLSFLKENGGEESFKKFLFGGGFPEVLKSKDDEYLRSLLRDIVIRDIAVRRNIKNEHIILSLAMHLISNVGKEISYNNISRLIGIKSVRSTIDYCDYLKESYLFDFVPRFSFSIKQQLINPKKIYAIDTGMANANSLSFSEDYGRMLENSVFMHLRRFTKDILYYKDETSECDFLIRKNERIVYAVQVCWHLTEDNLKREIAGLTNAMKTTNCQKGVIITFNQDDSFEGIIATPAWKWMKEGFNLENI